jgi:tetratricopeptide (TPR) repeat protein
MKAEHRHELKTNALADTMGRIIQGLKAGPSRHALIVWGLLGLAVVVGVTWYFVYKGHKEGNSALWLKVDEEGRKLNDATNADEVDAAIKDIEKTAKDNPNTTQARVLRFDRARGLIRSGLEHLAVPSKHDQAVKDITDARTLYSQLAKESADSHEPVLEQEALMSIAKADESLGELDQAQTDYQKLADKYPNSALGKAAKERADYLGDANNRKQAQELYDELAKAARGSAGSAEKPEEKK